MRSRPESCLAAIDVGTNAVRLEISRPLPDGTLETLHQERDPVRPGEGVFTGGSMPDHVVDRLVSTLRRYAALCRRHRAKVRAVATSALREARNRDDIVKRVAREAGLALEVITGREEARLICLGVLAGRPNRSRTLVVDIGGGSTEVVTGTGDQPEELASVPVGAVRLTQLFDADGRVPTQRLEAMRAYAREAFAEALPRRPGTFTMALGSSGTINAIVAACGDGGRLKRRVLEREVEETASLTLAERRRRFEPRRAEIIVAGAVILEAALRHLGVKAITAVDTGLRNGVLLDLARRNGSPAAGPDWSALALGLGRRLGFDEPHALQVARLALRLFDSLAALHRLPASARPLLEAAALLHDVGHAVNPSRHHKHSYYVVANADLPGVGEADRRVVALVARYHRRSAPDAGREDLRALGPEELRTVRRLVALLRVADALDRSHHQPVRDISVGLRGGAIRVTARARGPIDLERWDVEREAPLFRQILGRRLEIVPARR